MFKQVRICQNIIRQSPQLQSQIKSVIPQFGFSASAAQPKSSYEKAREKYQEHIQAFREKAEKAEIDNKPAAKKAFPKGYTHPFHSEHHPLNFSAVKVAEFFHEFVGPEQVSAHYENYLVSRKYLMIFFGGVFALSFGAATLDLHWMAKSALLPWAFWFALQYFYLELRKSFFKPLLMRWYRRVSANECYNFDVYYNDNIELKVRDLIRISKDQLEFWQIHKDFLDVKAESIMTFMSNEHANLQKHISERAQLLLKQAHAYEEVNRTRVLQRIVEDASKEIDLALEGPQREQINRQMFDSALIGLSKGVMEYENDPILPIVQSYIRTNTEKYSNLTEDEQRKLVSLSESQIQSLRDLDKKIKRDFLETEPKSLDNSLKAHEQAKKILASWGN